MEEHRFLRSCASILNHLSRLSPSGLQEFTNYLRKEYSHENIRFWLAVNDLRRSSQREIPQRVKEIYK